MADVLCKPPFTEVVEKNRTRCQRALQDFDQPRKQDCGRPARFQNAKVRERSSRLSPRSRKRTSRRSKVTNPAHKDKAPGRQSRRLRILEAKPTGEIPRLCRGGSNSLTFQGVHQRNFQSRAAKRTRGSSAMDEAVVQFRKVRSVPCASGNAGDGRKLTGNMNWSGLRLAQWEDEGSRF